MSIESYPSPNGVLTSLIWRKTATGGETSLSGYDNASQALSYTPGQEQVYLNGILLVRGSDYTATNGTSITNLVALTADDFIQVNCYNNFSVASVPANSITGTIANNQLQNSAITINGSAISLGGLVTTGATLLSTTTLSGASTTISIGSQAYRDLLIVINGVTNATATGSFRIAPNGSTNITYTQATYAALNTGFQASYLFVTDDSQKMTFSNASNAFALTISQYSSTTSAKPFISSGYYYNTGNGSLSASSTTGAIDTTSAITSLVFSNTGGNFTAGTVKVYGIN